MKLLCTAFLGVSLMATVAAADELSRLVECTSTGGTEGPYLINVVSGGTEGYLRSEVYSSGFFGKKLEATFGVARKRPRPNELLRFEGEDFTLRISKRLVARNTYKARFRAVIDGVTHPHADLEEMGELRCTIR